jgi:hypothetical protein
MYDRFSSLFLTTRTKRRAKLLSGSGSCKLKYLEGQRSPHRGSIFPGHLGLGFKIDQRADFAVGSLAPGGMGDLGREEIAAGFARRLRDAAAEFAAFAVLAEMAADKEASLFPPQAL